MRKINIDTDIRLAMTGARVRKFLAENPEKFDAREWLKPAREAAYKVCKQRYQEFGCDRPGLEDQGPHAGRGGQAVRQRGSWQTGGGLKRPLHRRTLTRGPPASGPAAFETAHPPRSPRSRKDAMTTALFQSNLHRFPAGRGKVRDNYAVGDDRILMVATDRLSAFDVVMSDPIPGKGEVLTKMALFWFEKLKDIVPIHLTGEAPESVVQPDEVEQVRGRSMLVKRLKPLPVGSGGARLPGQFGLEEYRQSGSVCGVALPPGLKLASGCPSPSSPRPPRPKPATTTRTSASSTGGTGRDRPGRAGARRVDPPVPGGPAHTPWSAGSSSPTRNSRVRPGRRKGAWC